MGHIPEGDGVLMGLLLIEMVAAYGVPLEELVEDLLKTVGPSVYERKDLRIAHPVNKEALTRQLCEAPPSDLGGVRVQEVRRVDGVKYILADELVAPDPPLGHRAGPASVC